MPRVAGIDPGHAQRRRLRASDDGRLFLDATWPTAELLADPRPLLRRLAARRGRSTWSSGPSGYGLPLRPAPRGRADEELRLAFLAPLGRDGRHRRPPLARAAARRGGLAAGVHARRHPSRHRAAPIASSTGWTSARPTRCAPRRLAIAEQSGHRRGLELEEVSLVLLELGGAFTAGIAVRARADRRRAGRNQRTDRLARGRRRSTARWRSWPAR